jgi:hypothetical protein
MNRYEVRAVSGNNYDVEPSPLHCDCPDYQRILDSGYGIVKCKHIYMVETAISDPSLPEGIPYSCAKVAEMCGADERTIQFHCQRGDCIATKKHDVWVIQPSDADFFTAQFLAGVWPYGP